MGAIDGHDVGFIAGLMQAHGPKTVVEIGCASGLSTAMMSHLLSQMGSARLHSFDLLDYFYASPDKPLGYLLDEGPDRSGVEVKINPGCTVLDVADRIDGKIDLCFIDASHEHPWPLIDTLAILPLMRPGGIIVHHDLQMYKGEGNFATGPKILLDQAFPDSLLRHWAVAPVAGQGQLKTRAMNDNIFALKVNKEVKHTGYRLANGFYLGWERNARKGVPDDFADAFCTFLDKTYDPYVRKAFEVGMDRYNRFEREPDANSDLWDELLKPI